MPKILVIFSCIVKKKNAKNEKKKETFIRKNNYSA